MQGSMKKQPKLSLKSKNWLHVKGLYMCRNVFSVTDKEGQRETKEEVSACRKTSWWNCKCECMDQTHFIQHSTCIFHSKDEVSEKMAALWQIKPAHTNPVLIWLFHWNEMFLFLEEIVRSSNEFLPSVLCSSMI